MDKFKNVGIDKDTKIIEEKIIQYKNIDVLYQKWVWEGIIAYSLIFRNEDIKKFNLKTIIDEINLIKNKENITTNKNDKYFFINFNFKIG